MQILACFVFALVSLWAHCAMHGYEPLFERAEYAMNQVVKAGAFIGKAIGVGHRMVAGTKPHAAPAAKVIPRNESWRYFKMEELGQAVSQHVRLAHLHTGITRAKELNEAQQALNMMQAKLDALREQR